MSHSHYPNRRRTSAPGHPRTQLVAFAVAVVAALSATACRSENDSPIVVNIDRRAPVDPPDRGTTVRFAVGTMLSPRESLVAYQSFASYLGARIGHPVEVSQRKSYTQTNDLLVHGQADFGFICSGAYAALKPTDAQLLVVPVVDGKTTYQSFVVVRKDDDAGAFEDLRGSSFAYMDTLSLTGRLYPQSLLESLGGARFFSGVQHAESHTESIRLVADGQVRAAAVDSLVYKYAVKHGDGRARSLRVLKASDPFGIPPFVTRTGLPDSIRQPLRKHLLAMHDNVEGRAVLAKLGFDRFELAHDDDYETARSLRPSTMPRGD